MLTGYKRSRKAYKLQRYDAARRGITWYFNYISWKNKWIKSGHWHERGCHKGQYVMARFGDKGPYASWNVRICTVEENYKEAKPQEFSSRTRLKMSHAQLGKRHSIETKKKISVSQKGRKFSIETKAKMSAAKIGNKHHLDKKHSSKTRSKMSAARRKWWFEKKQREFTKRKLADLCLL